MQWAQNNNAIYIPKYKYRGSNQHGDSYKKIETKILTSVTLSANVENVNTIDLKTLILLSDRLNVPVRYDFSNPQRVYVELISAEILRNILK